MKKTEVTMHSDGYGRDNAHPAVNVKIYARVTLTPQIRNALAAEFGEIPAEFSDEWIESHLTQDARDHWWEAAIDDGWNILSDEVQNAGLPRGATVHREGRSGGWAVVYNLPPVESWDAIMLGKWRQFAKWARATADDTPFRYYDLIYSNVFEPIYSEALKRAERKTLRDGAGL